MESREVHIHDAISGEPIAPDDGRVFGVRDQRRYLVRAERPLTPHGGVLRLHAHEGNLRGTLFFDNYVGLAEISGLRFRVAHSKLTDEAFAAMLDGVVADVTDLAFDFGSPTARPFERDDRGASEEVRYHALAYLRHVMLRAEHPLAGQFLQVARHPHRRMDREVRWMPVDKAAQVGPSGLLSIAKHPERLAPVSAGSVLAQTGLGQRLGALSAGRLLFPGDVRVTDPTESFDTHENRLVLHVLRHASDVLHSFEGRRFTNVELGADVQAMREEIDWMRTFDFLGGVGPMQIVPSQSSVLQRREGYRDFWGHYLRMAQSSILSEARDRWHSLLDLKDGALLYELFCFFEVKRTLDTVLGSPGSGSLAETEEERRRVPWSAKLVYRGGQVELVYNRSYPRGGGSYSVTLRPDLVVRVKRGSRWEALVLDAKLKFDGARLDGSSVEDLDDDPAVAAWERTAKKEDLAKMHAYRDAIGEAVGAFVLYPGSTRALFRESEDGPIWSGVGAIPLEPGKASPDLRLLLGEFLG